jgi:hypothetical protein
VTPDQESQAAEHALLDDVMIRREQFADAVGEILVVRHERIIATLGGE